MEEKAKAGQLVQDGRLLFEMGKLDEAEKKLKQAIKIDPQNQAAYYYLNLIREARYKSAEHRVTSIRASAWSKSKKAWEHSGQT